MMRNEAGVTSADVTRGRAASWIATRLASGDAAMRPLKTESCRSLSLRNTGGLDFG